MRFPVRDKCCAIESVSCITFEPPTRMCTRASFSRLREKNLVQSSLTLTAAPTAWRASTNNSSLPSRLIAA
ncbi:MAG TPA: hypothetical protein VGB68_04695 [Pyrinomonadaceae bacterium]